MEKTIIHQFDPVIYPFKLWVSITDDLNVISEKFIDHKSGKELSKDNPDKTIAFTQCVEQKSDYLIGAIIVFRRKGYCSTKIIAHEATHAARMIWDHVGEEATGMEADAYLVGWIAECIEKVKLNKF